MIPRNLKVIALCAVIFHAVTAQAQDCQPSATQANACVEAAGKSTPLGFTDDLEAACAEAAKAGKMVLAVFSGSDWCHWSKALEKNYLSKPEFVEAAKKDFVLVFIDSPKDRSILSDLAVSNNNGLVEKYKIKEFPAVKILTADGSEVIGVRPRNGASPKEYVVQLRRACTAEGRSEILMTEISRDIAKVISKAREERYSAMLDLAGFIVEPLESAATNYLPKVRALRTEIEKMDAGSPKDALSIKIDNTLFFLEMCRRRDVEGLAELLLISLKKVDSDVGRGWSPCALSLVPACEFPGREKDVCGMRMNLLGGRHHDVAGIDVGCIYNSVSNGIYGVQAGGLCNFVAHDMWGMQFAGLVNVGGAETVGIQAAGLANVAGDVCGAQLSGSCSIGLKVRGFQISGGGNVAAIVKGCQIGTVGNIALAVDGLQIAGELNSAYRLCGLQCSAIVNSGNILDGVQLSAVNLSDNCQGVQIGVINKGTDVMGLQVGVVNYANTMVGCQVGVCNVIKTSAVPILPIINMNF